MHPAAMPVKIALFKHSITSERTCERIFAILGDAGRAIVDSWGFALSYLGPMLLYGYRSIAFGTQEEGPSCWTNAFPDILRFFTSKFV